MWRIWQVLTDFWRGYGLLGAQRSSQWRQTQQEYLESVGNRCEITGTKGTLLDPINVHHVILFSEDPSKENDKNNLIAVRRSLHFWLCHLGNWSSSNPDIKKDAIYWRQKIKNRT